MNEECEREREKEREREREMRRCFERPGGAFHGDTR